VLQIHALTAGYATSRVLHGVHLEVQPGEIVGLLGRNGSGRSTLVKAVMGLVEANGSARWEGRELLGLRPFEVARLGVGYVPEGRDIFSRLTVEQNLRLGEPPRGVAHAEPRRTLQDMYQLFPPLHARRDTNAGVLSGGEQQMLAIARTLMGNPRLLLIDEPTEGLAPALVERVAALLRQLQDEGLAVLLVEQKLTIALELASRCCVMGHGRIVFDGSPQALQADQALVQEWLQV
jgi:branched-chain amino acid transport system ATP-binding protein